jgi:hypothetical protein
MKQGSLCSPDRTRQGHSELRVVLQQLVETHGMPAVKQVLRSIEAANLVENTRSRGRPRGPAIDDFPALQEAAAIWRRQGGGPVWPALTAVAKSLRGEPQSNARRLLSRLQDTRPCWTEKFVRAGINDFSAASLRKFVLALGQAVINKTNVKLTYTLEEYQELNELVPLFRNELAATLRDVMPRLHSEDKEYVNNLKNELTAILEYIANDMQVARSKSAIKLTFDADKYNNFVENIGFLQLDLLGFQDWYYHAGDYEEAESFEKLLNLNDVLFRLLRLKIMLDN